MPGGVLKKVKQMVIHTRFPNFVIIRIGTQEEMVEQLVERIRNKDQQAMRQLYLLYVEYLSSVCYRFVPSEDDAKDVLQNSFVKMLVLNIFTSCIMDHLFHGSIVDHL